LPTSERIQPFFLVGCGRSGTSLLRGILNGHPLIAIPLESLFIADYLRSTTRWSLDHIKGLIVQEPELREWGLQVSTVDLKGCQSVSEVIVRLHELYAESQGKPYWGQKTPRLVRHLELLREHFRTARFIHLVRDPRAVVGSLVRSNVHHSTLWDGAMRWVKDVGAGLAYEERHPQEIMRLSYEKLVGSPEQAVGAVMDFLGLEFDRRQLEREPGVGEYSAFYANIHANLNRRVTNQFVDHWRNQLSEGQSALIEALAGPVMERLGYAREARAAPALRSARLGTAWRRLWGLMQQFWRYLRYRRAYLYRLVWRKWRLGLLGEFLGEIYY